MKGPLEVAERAAVFALLTSSLWATGVTADTNNTSWSASYRKARALVANMTLAEMNNVTYGQGSTGCSGTSGGVPRLGYPGMCFQDAGNGIRGQDGVSAFASGVSVGASWNRELTYLRGQYMGAEFRAKGANVALGPVVGPVGRIALGGRNWEGFAADPYLDGQLAIPSIHGLQNSVVACVKHYVANEQETNRTTSYTVADGLASSSNVDDRTMHEVYVWPFEDAVHAGVGSIMCSYNRLNGTYACEDDKSLNGILKAELGFKGFVVSDWGGQHSGLESATGGLDLAMPASSFWDNGKLSAAVSNGSLSRTRLEDMATRILATWIQLGQDSAPSSTKGLGFGLVGDLSQPHPFVNARDKASASTILDGAIEGHVLVKNVNKTLPLKTPQILSLFGNDALPPSIHSPFDGGFGPLTFNLNYMALGNKVIQTLLAGTYKPSTANGTLIVGGGSGANTAPYISMLYDALTHRAIADGTQLFWNFDQFDVQVEGASDACIVSLNAYSGEGWDRPSLSDAADDELVQSVAKQCNNTIVVIHNAGIRVVDAWIDHPNIKAVIYAHLPGQDAGRALTSVLYGDVSPSGRLPYTVAKNESDYGSLLGPCPGPTNNTSPQCNFTEGVNIDYRSFLARNVTPRYEFGYGLTYSEFTYSNLEINVDSAAATRNSTSIFDDVVEVNLQLTNTGEYTAAEVPQLYLQIPGAETKALRGFDKQELDPKQSTDVSFDLRRKDISTWDVEKQRWVQPRGTYLVTVGASVLDTRLTGSFNL